MTFSRTQQDIERLEATLIPWLPHLGDKDLLEAIEDRGLLLDKDEHRHLLIMEFEPQLPPSVRCKKSFAISDVQMKSQLLDYLGMNIETEKIATSFIQRVLTLSGIKLGVLYNPHYWSWENKRSPGVYKYRGGLKVYHDPKLDAKAVDLSKRPGRIAATGDWRFVGASDYWFGPAIFEVFPREHLLAFKQALSIQELPNGIIHLQLLHLDEYWSDDSQARIRALREHLEIDRLEGEYRKALRDLWEQRHGKPGKLT
ncbi:MAG: hypothetical protein AAFQ92_27515 [Bacteroidota bacterium]